MPTNLEAVQVREHDIENECIVPAVLQKLEPLSRRWAGGHVDAELAEILCDHCGEPLIIFDHQNPFSHGTDLPYK